MTNIDNYPLVSVVMATYNGERFITKQIESILQQTYPAIELVVVDDGSSDNTLKIVESYARKHNNIRVYSNEINLGYVKNFEKAMQLSNGNFIAPADQDDIWHADKLITLFKNIQEHEIIYSDSLLIDEHDNFIGKKMSDIRRQRGYNNCLMYAIGSWAPGHAMLIKRQLIERAIPFPTVISHDLWLGFVATCRSAIAYLDTPLVYYRQHAANVFGAIKVGDKVKTKKIKKDEELDKIRLRMKLMYEKCPDDVLPEKQVLYELHQSYQSFTLKNNFKRMMLFFAHRDKILAYKNKSAFGRWLFCFKMFVKIK